MATIPLSIQVPPSNPADQMLKLAQLRDMQQQAAMRELQAQQLRYQMGEYQRFLQGGGLQGLADLSRNTTGQLPQPTAPAPTPAPGPIVQEPLPVGGSWPPGGPGVQGQAAPVSEPSSAGLAQPQETPQIDQSTMDEITQRRNLYQSLLSRYPLMAERFLKPMMELDQMHLEQRKQQFTMQKEAMGMIAQQLSAIQDLPVAARPGAYQQTLGMLTHWGLPGVEQLPRQYDPGRLGALATSARTAEERAADAIKFMEAQTKEHQAQTQEFESRTGRQRAGTEARAEQRLGTEQVLTPTPGGIVSSSRFGGAAHPLPGPAGGVAQPMEAGKGQWMYSGNTPVWVPELVPPGVQPQGRRVQVPPAAPQIPGYAAPQAPQTAPPPSTGGVAVPGAGATPPAPGPQSQASPAESALSTPAMYQQEQARTMEAWQKQIDPLTGRAQAAVRVLHTLDAMDKLIRSGYPEGVVESKLDSGAVAKIAQQMGITTEQAIAKVREFKSLASRLVTDSMGSQTIRANESEMKFLDQQAGGMADVPTRKVAKTLVDSLRRKAYQDLGEYNKVLSAAPGHTTLTPYPVRPTMSEAEFEKEYQNAKKTRPSVTRNQLRALYEQDHPEQNFIGRHIEGGY